MFCTRWIYFKDDTDFLLYFFLFFILSVALFLLTVIGSFIGAKALTTLCSDAVDEHLSV